MDTETQREMVADIIAKHVSGPAIWDAGVNIAHRHDQLTAADNILAALNAAPASPVPGWRTIESAPKMKGVLLWADTSTPDFPNWRMGSGYYHTSMDCWIWEGEQVREWAHPPTHWMPLPAAPSEDKPC